MTREILNKIAKVKKIDLAMYDHINGFINEQYTKVFVTLGTLEVVGGSRYFYNQKTYVFLVSSLQKKEEFEWLYTTQGWERIEYIH